MRVGSQIQTSIALPSNASWYTVELTQIGEFGKKNLAIKRRRDDSALRDVISAINELELSKSGDMAGYRQMTQWLKVGQERARELLKICDPERVAQRSKHRLKRKRYVSKSPNYLRHIEGYKKLKPFCFCIHGCIDGFTRRIM